MNNLQEELNQCYRKFGFWEFLLLWRRGVQLLCCGGQWSSL